MGASGWTHFDADRVAQVTEKAVCVIRSGVSLWIPKSVLDGPERFKVGVTEISVSVRDWWAEKNQIEGD